jgi:hypothetical protein
MTRFYATGLMSAWHFLSVSNLLHKVCNFFYFPVGWANYQIVSESS